MSKAYYNEIDPFTVQWLKNLIQEKLIADGEVDDRDIRDVLPSDLQGFTQHHFFAGIGGWSYALRLAGWPDDRPVWTGSCPCQPFSTAGRRVGFVDERHLWPSWFHLIRTIRPPVIFGEQVASKDGLVWLDLVSSDLEGEGYSFGAADLCAAGIGAPHLRQRLWFVADPAGSRLESGDSKKIRQSITFERLERLCAAGRLGNTDRSRLQGRRILSECSYQLPVGERGLESAWAEVEWLTCQDGKARPTEPGLCPLAHGISSRVGRLRAYGNAIVPQVAAVFIRAYNND